MKRLIDIALRLKIWNDNRGQDLIEYALMAGFVAVAEGHECADEQHDAGEESQLEGAAEDRDAQERPPVRMARLNPRA